jgi:hypothetical protein
MKLWDNIRLLTRDKTPKLEHFWVYYKGERTIFPRGPKTYGSPFIYIFICLKNLLSVLVML